MKTINAAMIAVFLCLPNIANSSTLETTGYVLLTLDYLQTKQIVKRDNYIEANPLLGKNPDLRTVNMHFLRQYLLHYLFNQTKFKRGWNVFINITESAAVANNYSVGIRIEF